MNDLQGNYFVELLFLSLEMSIVSHLLSSLWEKIAFILLVLNLAFTAPS